MDSRTSRGQRRHTERTRSGARWVSRLIWMSTWTSLFTAIILCGCFAYGVYAAVGGSISDHPAVHQSPTDPTSATVATKRTMRIVVLGDSLAHGFGDASGLGFAGDVAADYRHAGYGVIETNLGIDGLTSRGLLPQVRQVSIRNLVRRADVLLVSIGGNDLHNAAGLPTVQIQRVNRAQRTFLTNLSTLMTELRHENPSATIAVVGLYNPYGNIRGQTLRTNALVQGWTTAESLLVNSFAHAVFVPVFDLFQVNASRLLYSDHFHPNQLGYQRIATRIWQDLQNR